MKKAERKKMQRTFKVGDIITWGCGVVSHRILEVKDTGVVVDATSQGFGELFVAFDGNNRNRNGRGPIWHSDVEPDQISEK